MCRASRTVRGRPRSRSTSRSIPRTIRRLDRYVRRMVWPGPRDVVGMLPEMGPRRDRLDAVLDHTEAAARPDLHARVVAQPGDLPAAAGVRTTSAVPSRPTHTGVDTAVPLRRNVVREMKRWSARASSGFTPRQ